MRLQLVRPPAKLSSDVVLTLDLVLQHVLERELDRAMEETGARAATGIVLDPTNGQILAMSNRPTVVAGRGGAEARRNRAVTDLYEPGSTFKAFTAAAALDRGRVFPHTLFDCRALTIAGKAYKDTHVHGTLSLREILEASSNIGIIKVGRTIPREDLRETVVRFGFGRRTGVELPGERAGRVTALAGMSALSPASMSMGYEIAVTPLQVASAIGAIANGGTLVPPRVVLGTRDVAGTFEPSPVPEARTVISPQTAVSLQDMLEGVVLRGTGTRAAVSGYRVAGKTGTARKARPGGGYTSEYFSSFVGFGPLASPRLVVLVVLDTPTSGAYYGGLIAAPVVGRILSEGFAYLRVPHDDDPWKAREERQKLLLAKKRSGAKPKPAEPAAAVEPEVVAIGPGQVPDFSGKTLREASVALASLGCRVGADGSGVVIRQVPAPGSPLPPGPACRLLLGERPEPPSRRAPARPKGGPR